MIRAPLLTTLLLGTLALASAQAEPDEKPGAREWAARAFPRCVEEINTSEQVWCGWQFDRPDLARGFAMLLRRPRCPYTSADLSLRGSDPRAQYEVEFRETYETKEKRLLTGGELARLRVEIRSAPGSVLITYRKVGKL